MHKRLIQLIKKSPIFFIVAVISAEIGAILLVFQFQAVANFTNQIIFENQQTQALWRLITVIVSLILLRAIFQFSTDYLAKRQAGLIKSHLRKKMAEKMTRVGIEQGKNSAYYETLFIDGIESLENYFGLFVPQILIAVFIPVTILIFVIPIDRLTMLVFLATAPLIPLFMMLIGRFSKQHTEKQYRTLSLMNAFFLDSIRGIKTILVFNQAVDHLKRIARISDRYHEVTLSVLKIAFLSAFALEFMSTLSTAVLAVEIGLRLLNGVLDFQTAFFILLIAPEFYLPIRNLGLRFHAAMDGVEAAEKIFELLDLQEPSQLRFNFQQHDFLKNMQMIRFEAVDARYPNQKDFALKNITFNIPLGYSSAIIGPSGSGKSTVFQILLRFIDPINGFAGLDQLPLSEIDIDLWRSILGWVPQKPYLYNGTILENIRLAKPGATLDEVNTVLNKASLADFVKTLPFGLETKLSDLGTSLSAGQRQRIAIARVLLKDAKILLFDELTASIDSNTEEKILETLADLRKNRTMVSIAHRLHTILDMDQIIMLNNGTVEGIGTHPLLVKESSFYQDYLDCYFGVRA